VRQTGRSEDAPDGGFDGLRRILPARLVGPGRRPAWQRTRLRRVASAGLVATAAGLAMSAFLPQPAARGVPIVAVAQDLTAGHVLTLGDLAVADWPTDLSPEGAVADPGTLVGRSLGAGMSRGEPVTAARLRGPGLLTGVQAGLVAAHVRLADPAMAAMAAPGDRVDLISPAGKVVATDVAILAVDGEPAAGGWGTTSEPGPPGGVIVAVSRDAAVRLATVDPSGLSDATFSLVLRTPGT
jgi:Flp pilus assembly protein CpaB